MLPPGVLAEIPVDAGTAPVAMTQAFGSLWINTHRGGKVYRLDPQTNKIIVTLPVDDCCSPPVAIGGHLVAGDQIIDPTTNRVVGSVSTNPFVSVGGTPWGVGVGTLAALDPQTLRPVRTIKVNANARGVSDPDTYVTYGDGSFWVIVAGDETQTFGGVVVEVDRHTGRVLHTYRTPDPGGDADIQFLDHAVWLKGDDSGSLVRLDARTGATHVYTLPGWQALTSYFPQTIAIGDGDLWIRNSTRTVVRFRPTTGRVVGTYPASPSANGGYVSIAFGSLWIANFDNDTIWRVRITA